MNTTIEVIPDARGESETFEAYSMVSRDAATGRVVWVEGIRKDRSAMYLEIRETVEAQLAKLRAEGR